MTLVKKIIKILEIGAGSGRTSEVFITLNENLNYVICDIPIASVIAFQKIKKSFPNKKISNAIRD